LFADLRAARYAPIDKEHDVARTIRSLCAREMERERVRANLIRARWCALMMSAAYAAL